MTPASNTPSVLLEQALDRERTLQEEIERLKAQNKRLLVSNLDFAITLAESDPLYMEILRPQFKRIHQALA